MKDGILIINKEKDITSRDVVNTACKKLNTKKIGHTGTLDPIATGVLVLGINEGTKIIELLTSNNKEYIAECIIGIETDTLDITGKILKEQNKTIKKEQLIEVLNSFVGTYEQEVPKYSAIKINGKKLYEYARSNEEIELPKRHVTIEYIELLEDIQIEKNYQLFKFKVKVSKGTYIRSLIRDIGTKLNVPTTMKSLNRTKQGIFNIEQSINQEDIDYIKIISIKDALCNYPSIIIEEGLVKKVKNGCKLNINLQDYTLVLDKEKNLLAIYEPVDENLAKPYRVFGGINEKN